MKEIQDKRVLGVGWPGDFIEGATWVSLNRSSWEMWGELILDRGNSWSNSFNVGI